MQNPAAELAHEEATALKRIKDTQHHRAIVDDIGYETRADGPITATGKHRRHKLGHNHAALGAFLKKPSLFAMAFMSDDNRLTWNDLPKLLEKMAAHFHHASGDKARHTEVRPGEDLSYIYKTMAVGEEVRKQLDEEIAEVEQWEETRDAAYAAGQYGPLGADFHIHTLTDLYQMRAHPVTGQKTFCESRVQTLQAAAPAGGELCAVVVYTAVPTSSLRGIHVKAADPNSLDDVKIAPSEEANKVAAAPVVRIQPQQLNFHLNG